MRLRFHWWWVMGLFVVGATWGDARVQAQPMMRHGGVGRLSFAMESPLRPVQQQAPEAPVDATNWALIAPGIAGLAGGFALALFTTLGSVLFDLGCFVDGIGGPMRCHSDVPEQGALLGWIPLLGPWIALPGMSDDPGWQAYYGILGTLQAAGLVLIIVGAAMPERVAVELARALPRVSPVPGGVVTSLAVSF